MYAYNETRRIVPTSDNAELSLMLKEEVLVHVDNPGSYIVGYRHATLLLVNKPPYISSGRQKMLHNR